jgi:probable F420-dependent oxidoreductase
MHVQPLAVDAGGYPESAAQAAAGALRAERQGYDAYWAPETRIDPLIACAAAAPNTKRIRLGTAITVAFARNPMTVAQAANDLQSLSGGRFLLGLGSQIRAHITRRFSMPWSSPAPRMREFILAVRAIWHSWATGEPLDFRGRFYTHTLMTPFFDPGPNEHGNPPILLAGVGARMTETAGEVADGLICHGFHTPRYLREVTIPALARGRARAGRGPDGFQIVGPVFAVVGDSEREREPGLAAVRAQIAFYGSTPAYRPVLDCHGWGELSERLHALSVRGRWDRMAAEIDEEVLDAFAVIGNAEEVAEELLRRYNGLLTRITLKLPDELAANRHAAILAALRRPA